MDSKQGVKRPLTNEIYRHFKGNLYKIITLALDSETGEDMVVYQAQYGDYGTYVRSLESFVEELDPKTYPEASQKHRFEAVNQEEQAPRLDPLLEAFLEAETYRERLNTLRGLEHRITDEMINTMAVVMDLDIPEGPLEKRYRDLENSILTLEKFECTRLV